ncbi:hypothetical protein EON66_10130 [archaeon]|nr:MAG: hypothetical protein EON66_10130 [archaeon]
MNEVDQDTAPEEMNFDISIDAEGDKTEEKLKVRFQCTLRACCVAVSISSSRRLPRVLQSLIQKHGIKDLRARIATFVEELKEKK